MGTQLDPAYTMQGVNSGKAFPFCHEGGQKLYHALVHCGVSKQYMTGNMEGGLRYMRKHPGMQVQGMVWSALPPNGIKGKTGITQGHSPSWAWAVATKVPRFVKTTKNMAQTPRESRPRRTVC